MVYGYLYRSLIIKGKVYYQLCKKGHFEYNDTIGTYNERFQKDYIFMPKDKNDTSDKLYSIYMDIGNNMLLKQKNDDKIVEEFYDKFHDFDKKRYNFIINEIKKDVWFQDEAIKKIVTRFLINREIIKQKESSALLSNILLYGKNSTGKNSIINFLKKQFESNTIFVDISLVEDMNSNLQSMFKEIIKCSDKEKISKAIVIIRDNYDEISESSDNEIIQENPYIILENFIKQISNLTVSINDSIYNFPNISFISIIKTESDGIEGLYEMGVTDNIFEYFDTLVETNYLNYEQVKSILLNNPNSYLKRYSSILKKIDKKLSVKGKFIDDIVEFGMSVNDPLNFIYNIISQLIKNEWFKTNIVLDSEKMAGILKNIIIDKDNKDINELVVNKINNDKDFKVLVKETCAIVKKSIKCQDDQINRIVYTILCNQSVIKSNIDNKKKYIKNILLRGQSGSGKTAIVDCLCKNLDIPMVVVDATRYTEAGYIGADVTDMLVDLYLAANSNLENAQNGILVIDEIDKKSSNRESTNDVSRTSVLNSLLKIIEGTKITLTVKKSSFETNTIIFDTSNLTVICSGAFENIEEIRDKRTGKSKKTIGFGNANDVKQDMEITDDDYVNYGMSRQFMARFPVIINLAKLDVNCLKKIITTSSTSELLLQKELFSLNGIELEYQNDFLEKLAVVAFEKNIGARGIEKAFQEVLTKVNIHDIALSNCKKIVFTADCIDDPSKLITIYNNKIKKLTL